MRLVDAAVRLKTADIAESARIVREERLPREALPTELLTYPEIWEAMLEDMPMTALVRNLGNLSKLDLLRDGSDAEAKVVAQLSDFDRLRKARLHPIAILSALTTYAMGHGLRGGGSWTVNRRVVDALDAAFYASFQFVEPAGKRLLLGLDVSGSMAYARITGLESMSCREGAGAMALVSLAAESVATTMAFDTRSYGLSISSRQRLDDVVKTLTETGGGGTNCALPIQYAIDNKIRADGIVVYTDSEAWQGDEHPAQAIQRYRRATGLDTKLVVVAMASNRFTIAGPKDPLTLNVVGLDASVPNVITQFLRD
jgi:60 kDa SS-A/Ro ribonucleoprotein